MHSIVSPRVGRLTVLGALALMIIWGVISAPIHKPPRPVGESRTDVALYKAIRDRVAAGEDYYAAAVSEQIATGYPVSPPMTVRTPPLTWIHATLGSTTAWLLLVLLILLALWMTLLRLEKLTQSRFEWFSATFLLAAGVALSASPAASFVHDAWAGALILLSINLWARHHVRSAVLVGLLAVCIRELAAPFLIAMCAIAICRRKKVESIWWVSAGIAASTLYSVHAAFVLNQISADSPASPGWFALNGWPYIVGQVRATTPMTFLPDSLTVVLVSLGFMGWLLTTGRLALAAKATLITFCLIFSIAGRENTLYWGLLYSGLLMSGVALAPRGLVKLLRGSNQ